MDATVRWNGVFSRICNLGCCVRQRGVVPLLFMWMLIADTVYLTENVLYLEIIVTCKLEAHYMYLDKKFSITKTIVLSLG
jgi:hypothetical protein